MQKSRIARRYVFAATALAAGLLSQAASAQVYITEWMYNGNGKTGEYIEFTNMGASAVDFTGWSFDDDSNSPGSVSLSLFGVVNPGQSVILTEASATDFRSVWGLSSSVKVIGGNSNNLGRADQINLYNGSTLVDRLSYGDETFPGTLRAQNVSGNPTSLSLLGSPYDPSGWVAATVGDAYGSHMEVANPVGNVDIGNPGYFALAAAPVPLPAAAWLLISGVAGLFGFGRRKRAA
jgi:hypothetical protein